MDNIWNILKGKASQPYFALKLSISILSLIGIGISGYLTYVHYYNIGSTCLFGTDCNVVLSSYYATMWDVPLALLGLLMYIVLAVLGLWSLLAKEGQRNMLDMGIYGMALSGTLFTIYLYYLEIFKIHAFCTWCIGSSIVIFIMLILSLINLFSGREKVEMNRVQSDSNSLTTLDGNLVKME